jgi:hypothetical protein
VGDFGIVWLRTHYEDTDAAHQGLLQDLNTDLGLEDEQNILDDQSLYAYGDDWSQIFEVLPERLFMLYPLPDDHSMDALGEFEDHYTCEQDVMPPGLEGMELDACLARMHRNAIMNYIFIADKTAMDTGKILVVFFDDHGRVVRSHRESPFYADEISGAWADGFYSEMDEFIKADIAIDYQPGGLYGPRITQ